MRKGRLEGRSIWSVERAHVRFLVVCLALLSLPGHDLPPRSYSTVQNQQPGKLQPFRSNRRTTGERRDSDASTEPSTKGQSALAWLLGRYKESGRSRHHEDLAAAATREIR